MTVILGKKLFSQNLPMACIDHPQIVDNSLHLLHCYLEHKQDKGSVRFILVHPDLYILGSSSAVSLYCRVPGTRQVFW